MFHASFNLKMRISDFMEYGTSLDWIIKIKYYAVKDIFRLSLNIQRNIYLNIDEVQCLGKYLFYAASM